ncbi:MAG: hypothetical protein DHS80DRAFT_22322 [Piptocephalis tieghemiana]|nr:MAG: hypothetical protein DHS80DRAFT_22322 [Piptocephalis tieghemiana]
MRYTTVLLMAALVLGTASASVTPDQSQGIGLPFSATAGNATTVSTKDSVTANATAAENQGQKKLTPALRRRGAPEASADNKVASNTPPSSSPPLPPAATATSVKGDTTTPPSTSQDTPNASSKSKDSGLSNGPSLRRRGTNEPKQNSPFPAGKQEAVTASGTFPSFTGKPIPTGKDGKASKKEGSVDEKNTIADGDASDTAATDEIKDSPAKSPTHTSPLSSDDAGKPSETKDVKDLGDSKPTAGKPLRRRAAPLPSPSTLPSETKKGEENADVPVDGLPADALKKGEQTAETSTDPSKKNDSSLSPPNRKAVALRRRGTTSASSEVPAAGTLLKPSNSQLALPAKVGEEPKTIDESKGTLPASESAKM